MAAKCNAAQAAVDVLRPTIEAELSKRPKKLENSETKGDSKKTDDMTDRSDLLDERKGKNALKVLREIRPGVIVAEKKVNGLPEGIVMASCVIDGCEFIGQGPNLNLAKALAAESAVTTLFGLQFEYSAGNLDSILFCPSILPGWQDLK